MYLRGVRVGSLSAADVESLVADEVQESRILEYKEQLNYSSDGDKKEFLADVSAFANTNGGVLLYGIREARDEKNNTTGRPEEIVGLLIQAGVDSLIAAIEARVSDGLSPRRRESGKYQVDVQELRSLFLERDEWESAAEAMRLSRVNRIRAGGIDRTFAGLKSTIFHMLPLGRLRDTHDVFQDSGSIVKKFLQGADVWDSPRGTLHGPIISHGISGEIHTYLMLLRNGGVEFGSTRFHGQARTNQDVYFYLRVPKVLTELSTTYVKVISEMLKIDPPFALLVSLNGANNRPMIESAQWMDALPGELQDDPVLIPLTVIENHADAAPAAERAMAMLRQAAGAVK